MTTGRTPPWHHWRATVENGTSDEPEEPKGQRRRSSRHRPRFVVQKHDASRLHYDFRLAVDGVLKSWAVPKGPTTDPGQKRLAVPTEDHPLEYRDFEGVIPQGEYGGGTVMVWDDGSYRNLTDEGNCPLGEAIERGHVSMWLEGKKLHGGWSLSRMRKGASEAWLLVKQRDEHARRARPLDEEPLAAQACITPHTWLSRADRADRPDRLIFDLDPSTDDLEVLRDAARSLRVTLEDLGLTSFVQTTGSRGFHVLVPLDRRAGFDEVRSFARGVAQLVAERDPSRLTTEQRKDKRGDRMYLDIMRNAYGQTSVPPYAVRARSGGPVATPLTWEELEKGDARPQSFHTTSVLERLDREGDPWAAMSRHAQSLQRPIKELARTRT